MALKPFALILCLHVAVHHVPNNIIDINRVFNLFAYASNVMSS